MVDSLISIDLPASERDILPSCGSLFSAISSLDITFILDITSEVRPFFVFKISSSTPSIRYLTVNLLSYGSIWISDAFFFRPSATIALINLIIGASLLLSKRSSGSGKSSTTLSKSSLSFISSAIWVLVALECS